MPQSAQNDRDYYRREAATIATGGRARYNATAFFGGGGAECLVPCSSPVLRYTGGGGDKWRQRLASKKRT